MGPTLARMARRALNEVGRTRQRVLAVARFSDTTARETLHAQGVETIVADLTDRAQIAALPDAANIIFMAGQKFGTTDAPEATWLMNAYVPAIVAERYAPTGARFVVFSTGCVYPNVPVERAGSREGDPLEPLGEYANSCVARERLFAHFCRQHHAPAVLFRLNYAVDLRYGVLVDVARKVRDGEPIDLTMGYANVLWQGDANAYALRALLLAEDPPLPLNVTGPETVRIREAARRFGDIFGREPRFVGTEARTALLSDASAAFARMGRPEIFLDTLTAWVAEWLDRGGRLLNKPTHYETRDGKY
jgi:nucleoside-diphosphate-sugar epimerase